MKFRRRLLRALVVAALLLPGGGLARAQDVAPAPAQAEPAAEATPAPAETPAPDAAPEPAETEGGREIEDDSLDELLELGLSDTLGTTEAVSRTTEDVLSAPATMTTLEARDIRLSGARTLPDLLRFVPGVQVVQTAPGSYLVALRGMSGLTGNNIVVTVDGVPINNPLDGSIDWGLVPIAVGDVERLEVVRGPVSTIYGANAYTGVINIVTFRGFGSEPQAGMRLEGGADTDFSPVAAGALRWLKNGKRVQQAWFGEAALDGANRDAEAGDGHPSLKRGSVLGRLGFSLDAGQLDFEVAAAYGSRPALEHLVLDHASERRLVSFASARFVSKELPGVLGRLTLWARSGVQRTDADRNRFTGFTYADTRSNRNSFGLDLSLPLHSTFTATVGGEYNLDHVQAPYLSKAESNALHGGVGFYVSSAWDPTRRLSFTAALRGDVPTVTAKTELSYRVSAVYHDANYAVRLAAASAYRAPTYVEAGGKFVDPQTGVILLEGEPNIKAPRNDAVELGLLYSPLVKLSFSATAYGSRMTNLVVEEFAPLVRRSFDAASDPTYLVGGEVDAKWAFNDAVTWRAFGAIVEHFSDDATNEIPTVAVEGMNSAVIAGSEFRGSLRRDRMRYGLGGVFSSARTYALASGIPPVLATREVAAGVVLTAMVEHEVGRSWPVWLYARAQSQLPRQVESPVPGASKIGTVALVGLERRWGQ